MKPILLASSIALSLFWIGSVAPTYAQVDPQPEPLPIPEPLPQEEPLTVPDPDLGPPGEDAIPIAVTRIQVVGNSILSPATIAELVVPCENRSTTLAELQQLAA
ncbi:MAG: hypothetical protein AAGH78_11295 [Cyanobacteria bacterium P01_H01_bin.58]